MLKISQNISQIFLSRFVKFDGNATSRGVGRNLAGISFILFFLSSWNCSVNFQNLLPGEDRTHRHKLRTGLCSSGVGGTIHRNKVRDRWNPLVCRSRICAIWRVKHKSVSDTSHTFYFHDGQKAQTESVRFQENVDEPCHWLMKMEITENEEMINTGPIDSR